MLEDQNTSEDNTTPEYWIQQIQKFNFFGEEIPEHMHEGLAHYIAEGRPPGDFLRAVVQNDLYLSISRADPRNLWKLQVFVAFLHSYAPATCWGDENSVKEWCEQRGMIGIREKKKNENGS